LSERGDVIETQTTGFDPLRFFSNLGSWKRFQWVDDCHHGRIARYIWTLAIFATL